MRNAMPASARRHRDTVLAIIAALTLHVAGRVS
jgi:hypothetical protein